MVINLQKEVLEKEEWLGRKRRFCATVASRCAILNGATGGIFFSFYLCPNQLEGGEHRISIPCQENCRELD
jgi:hypothetical protein